MASILKVDAMQGVTSAGDITITSEGGAATQSLQQGLAKAWVNFNGTGTIAIRESINGSSLSDVGTGNYRLNFTSNMNSATYSFQIGSSSSVSNDGYNRSSLVINLASQGAVNHYESGGTLTDTDLLTLNIHGDLA